MEELRIKRWLALGHYYSQIPIKIAEVVKDWAQVPALPKEVGEQLLQKQQHI